MLARLSKAMGVVLVGSAVLTTHTGAQAGFTSSSPPFGSGKYQGAALTPAQTAKIQAAIDRIKNSGYDYSSITKPLQKALDRGDICKEVKADVCGVADVGMFSSSTGCDAEINIGCSYLDGAVEALASTLIHEMLHFQLVYPFQPEKEHCIIAWWEYTWCKRRLSVYGASGTAEQAALEAEVAAILAKYPSFDGKAPGGPVPQYSPGQTDAPNRKTLLVTATQSVMYVPNESGDIETYTWANSGATALSASVVGLPLDVVTDTSALTLSSGAHVLVVTGTNDAGTEGGVYALLDTDSDNVVDAFTAVVPLGTSLTRPNGLAHVDRVNGTTSWYVMDSCQGKVWSLTDVDTDNVPDALGAVFADTVLTTDIAVARGLAQVGEFDAEGHASGDTYLALTSEYSSEQEIRPDGWLVVLDDDNADGVADSASARYDNAEHLHYQPLLRAGGQKNDEFVFVRAPAGHTVQALGQNPSTGEYDVLLGQGTVPPGTVEMTFATTTFQLNNTFVLRDTLSGKESPVITVTNPVPTITALSPTGGPLAGGTTVTLEGVHFGPSPTVYFGAAEGTVISSTSTTIMVSTPSMGPEFFGPVPIRVEFSPTSEATDWYFTPE